MTTDREKIVSALRQPEDEMRDSEARLADFKAALEYMRSNAQEYCRIERLVSQVNSANSPGSVLANEIREKAELTREFDSLLRKWRKEASLLRAQHDWGNGAKELLEAQAEQLSDIVEQSALAETTEITHGITEEHGRGDAVLPGPKAMEHSSTHVVRMVAAPEQQLSQLDARDDHQARTLRQRIEDLVFTDLVEPQTSRRIVLPFWRWRREVVALIIAMMPLFAVLAGISTLAFTSVFYGGLAALASLFPTTYRWVGRWYRSIVLPGQVISGCDAARIRGSSGNLPAVADVWVNATSEHVLLWCEPGIRLRDFELASPIIGKYCYDKEIDVALHERHRSIVVLRTRRRGDFQQGGSTPDQVLPESRAGEPENRSVAVHCTMLIGCVLGSLGVLGSLMAPGLYTQGAIQRVSERN